MSTPFDTNWKMRVKAVESIVEQTTLAKKYMEKDPANLKDMALIRLTDSYFHLYELNKEYDRLIDTRLNPPVIPPKKTFWQKLLRK